MQHNKITKCVYHFINKLLLIVRVGHDLFGKNLRNENVYLSILKLKIINNFKPKHF